MLRERSLIRHGDAAGVLRYLQDVVPARVLPNRSTRRPAPTAA